MGAGNPILRSYDNEMYKPTTYFVDFTNDEEDEDSPYYEDIFEDFCEGLISELELKVLSDNRGQFETDSDLSSAFRDEGILLLEGENCFVISETGSDYHHVPFAVIPNFKFDNIIDELWYENVSKQEWYEQRNKSYSDRIDILAEQKWEKLMKKFYKEEQIIIDKLKQFYPESLSVRNGAWTSCKVA